MKTTVCKFGGTSLADASQFRKVRDIIMADPSRTVIVASAPGKRFSDDIKVTDLLLDCYSKAKNKEDFEPVLHEIRDRFQEIMTDLGVEMDLESELQGIREHLKKEPSQEYMASRGEYLNSRILAAYLGFTFVDPAWCVCFNEDGSFDSEMTQRAMGAALKPLKNAVVAGFYGAEPSGRIHTFSRGGSDISGSLAARAIGADLYENWTDVSGLLVADPRLVENPQSVDYLSYRELRTLSYMGASVLHADAVFPASRAGIPINIRNTNRPEDAGTMIVNKLPRNRKNGAISGVTGRKGMSVIQVEKLMVSDGAGFSAIMLEILKNMEIPFEQCLTGIDTITLVLRSDLLEPHKEALLDEIKRVLNPDTLILKEQLSMIAVVGENYGSIGDALIKILHAVAAEGVEIKTINQGAGKLNLLIGVYEEHYDQVIKAIYKAIG